MATGYVKYHNQLGINLGDRMSFDQTVPYTICCNYEGGGSATFNHKFCLVETPGEYSVGNAATEVLLGKDVSVILSDCHVDMFCTAASGTDVAANVNLYVGTTDDVLGNDTVYLYQWFGYLIGGHYLKLDIPDISGFVVPSGKNIVCEINVYGAGFVDGHFVSSVDD